MFYFKESGKGVENGKWQVFYIRNAKIITVKFFDKKYQAVKKAEYLNKLIKEFVHLIINI